jgi:glycosyltransferase involved in cell wall biosynthesis
VKVLVFTQMYPSEEDPHNGTFVYDEVAALRKRVDEVEVLYFNTKESRLNYFHVFPRFRKLVEAFKPDIVHCHHTFCVFIAWAAGCRNIALTFHEGEYLSKESCLDRVRREGPTKILVHSKWFKRFCLRKASYIFDVTGALKQWPNATSPFVPGVNPEKFFPIAKTEARQKIGWHPEEKIILFPGKPKNPVKRYDLAEEIVAMTEVQIGCPVRIVPLSNIPHDEVKYFIAGADLMLLVSDYEASPMVLKEALSCGLPCVAFNVGDACRVLSADPYSVVTDSDTTQAAAAVAALFLDPPKERVNRLASEFTVNHGAEIVLAAYRDKMGL